MSDCDIILKQFARLYFVQLGALISASHAFQVGGG